jgi:hypothetical protein
MTRIVRYPQWIRVLGESGNPNHPVSARFSGLDMYWASPLLLYAVDGVEIDYLFTTTANAWTMREPFNLNPEMIHLFERDAAMTRGTKVLAASLSGIFPSWFEGMPKPEQHDGSELADMPSQARLARIIVVGDTGFATTLMNATGGQRNLDFLVQVAGWLCNDDDIIGIRARESRSGRLDRILDPTERAAAMRNARFINIYLVPSLVIVAGIFLAMRRRSKALPAKAFSTKAQAAENIKERSDDV